MLELQHVNFSYERGKEVLHDINLKLDQAQVIGIIGPNGSGKSTLFLNLVGIQRPDSGQILLDGQPLRYDKKSLLALRKRIGIVF